MGEPERNPRETEFFRLTEPVEALVREAIQNSLDARGGADVRVKVRFGFGKIDKTSINSYLRALDTHMGSAGLLPPEYTDSGTISFIVIEDFETTGLDGETSGRPEPRSNFYNFWWCEGKSYKAGREAGRWGLGKTTFHMVSKLRVFFGLTLRSDDNRKLLMGKALLKTHRIGNDVYSYEGYFTTDDNYTPVSDEGTLEDFKRKFAIRRENESGLSLVILMPDERITSSDILKYSILHYFYPVFNGMLEIQVEDTENTLLNKDNLCDLASTLNWDDSELEDIDVNEILSFVRSSVNAPPDTLTIDSPESPEINVDSFGERLSQLKQSLNDGNLLKFRIPVRIIKSNGNQSDTYFEISCKKQPALTKAIEFYVRSGIRILPRTPVLGGRPVMAMLVADDPEIATFLGDAENPAHTEWNERTGEFREKYSNACPLLRFIKKSMGMIVSFLDEPPRERQRDFLKEIFSIPMRMEDEEEGEETTHPPVIPLVQRPPRIFVIERIPDGFNVSLNRSASVQLPVKARIMVAYDVRRGNPFKQYELFDFDLSQNVIDIALNDCSVIRREKNYIELEITGQNFSLTVTGFDSKRDLVVDVKKIEKESHETEI
jgi:hypothetical protein